MPDAPPQIPYRSGRDEPIPPSGWRVLLGVFLILLAIASTSLGGLVVLGAIFDVREAGPSRRTVPILLISAICFACNFWLIPRAVKSLRHRAAAGVHA